MGLPIKIERKFCQKQLIITYDYCSFLMFFLSNGCLCQYFFDQCSFHTSAHFIIKKINKPYHERTDKILCNSSLEQYGALVTVDSITTKRTTTHQMKRSEFTNKKTHNKNHNVLSI